MAPDAPVANADNRRKLGLFGEIKAGAGGATGTPAGGAVNGAAAQKAQIADRFRQALRTYPRDFTAFVSLTPDGRQATLYVLGRVPETTNPNLTFNFTVEARQHAPASVDSGATMEEGQPLTTLLDRQMLAPDTSGGADANRFFCFAYPLVAPTTGGQANFLISYWLDPSAALTHGVALARAEAASDPNPAASWITVPMTRMQRYQKDYHYTLVRNTEVGTTIRVLNRMRGK